MATRKILIVDDSATSLMMSQMILKRLPNCVFISAQNGKQAVEKAQAESPDLILMDIVMPVMDGLEAVRQIRASEATAQTPIIMLTTRSEMEYHETGFRLGCNDYVNKPIDAAELIAKVEGLLRSVR